MKAPNNLIAAGLALGLTAGAGCHPDMDVDEITPEACLAELTNGNRIPIDSKYYATPGEASPEKVTASGTYINEDGYEEDRWGIARDLDVVLKGDIDKVVDEDEIAGQLVAFSYNPNTVDPTSTYDSWESEDVWPADIENSGGVFNDPEDGPFMIVAEPGEDWFNNPTDVRVVVTRGCREIIEATNEDQTHQMFDAEYGVDF